MSCADHRSLLLCAAALLCGACAAWSTEYDVRTRRWPAGQLTIEVEERPPVLPARGGFRLGVPIIPGMTVERPDGGKVSGSVGSGFDIDTQLGHPQLGVWFMTGAHFASVDDPSLGGSHSLFFWPFVFGLSSSPFRLVNTRSLRVCPNFAVGGGFVLPSSSGISMDSGGGFVGRVGFDFYPKDSVNKAFALDFLFPRYRFNVSDDTRVSAVKYPPWMVRLSYLWWDGWSLSKPD